MYICYQFQSLGIQLLRWKTCNSVITKIVLVLPHVHQGNQEFISCNIISLFQFPLLHLVSYLSGAPQLQILWRSEENHTEKCILAERKFFFRNLIYKYNTTLLKQKQLRQESRLGEISVDRFNAFLQVCEHTLNKIGRFFIPNSSSAGFTTRTPCPNFGPPQ